MAGEEKAQRTASLGWKWVWLRMVLENRAEEAWTGVSTKVVGHGKVSTGVHTQWHHCMAKVRPLNTTEGCTG